MLVCIVLILFVSDAVCSMEKPPISGTLLIIVYQLGPNTLVQYPEYIYEYIYIYIQYILMFSFFDWQCTLLVYCMTEAVSYWFNLLCTVPFLCDISSVVSAGHD